MTNPATRTAHGPMFLAAIEERYPDGRGLTRDPLAESALPPGLWLMARIARVAWIRDAFIARLERVHPGGWAGIACRKRYFDEQAAAAIAAGIGAVVNLGAGLDTRVYRLPALAGVPAFEVDLPANIARKRAWIARTFKTKPPANVTLVPVDFDRQDLGAALQQAGLDPTVKTLFTWEGVTQYLEPAGVRRTMEVLARAPAGSRLVFTYVVQDFLDGSNLHDLPKLRDNPVFRLWRFGLDPDKVPAFLAEYGWQLREHPESREIEARYVRPTGRDLAVMPIERFVVAEKQ